MVGVHFEELVINYCFDLFFVCFAFFFYKLDVVYILNCIACLF